MIKDLTTRNNLLTSIIFLSYCENANKLEVMSKHLKTAFSIPPLHKSFSVKCPVAVRPGTILISFATLGGFLFTGAPL